MTDIETIRNKLMKDGYFVLKNFYKKEEVISFRNSIEKSITLSPNYNYRINNNKVKDYSHKRSHDDINRTLRYYMFFHNKKLES
jgi:ectoine hydroxylase-related dioxygenase (phytanoyl-CoA dioxygenase family)